MVDCSLDLLEERIIALEEWFGTITLSYSKDEIDSELESGGENKAKDIILTSKPNEEKTISELLYLVFEQLEKISVELDLKTSWPCEFL
jgi:hypothetical protein